MSFTPVVPFGSYNGWLFLQRTEGAQKAALENSSTAQREANYFRENIANVETAADLMADRRLLTTALNAFGLGEDINNKFFIEKVLTDGTIETDALANRLSDKRYFEFSKAFGFGDFDTPNTALSDFASDILERNINERFETLVGEQDEDLRLALNFDKAIQDVAAKDTTTDGLWYSVMGDIPLRRVLEVSLGLPSSFGSLDIDQQLSRFKQKAQDVFGTDDVRQFASAEKRDDAVRLFLLRQQAASFSPQISGAQNALALLS